MPGVSEATATPPPPAAAPQRVVRTAFGAASCLILEAVDATLLVQHGFLNAALAILATGRVILLAGRPISVHAARHGVDRDLLTRGTGAGFDLPAYLALTHSVPVERAVDPSPMYLAAWETVTSNHGWAVAATAVFAIVSQRKINVTNACAGSLAWSNVFSRLTHAHPARVAWKVFNTAIALVLMEMNAFSALGHVLGLYAPIAIAWMMAVVADLVVNKPLGSSPPGIEFTRAHLYDIDPVGVGAMGIASVPSTVAHLGACGPLAQALSAAIALITAFVASPLIAWATRGRYVRPGTAHGADRAGDRRGRRRRVLAQQFRFDAMNHLLDREPDEPRPA